MEQGTTFNRRDFIKTSALALAGVAAAGVTTTSTADAATKHSPSAENTKVNVDYEWGHLKEVIIGRTVNMMAPSLDELNPEILSFFPAPTRERIKKIAGKPWSESEPELYARAVKQQDDLAAFLEKRGIIVHRPVDLTQDEQQYNGQSSTMFSQMFPRDPTLVVGNHVIETYTRYSGRDRERFGLRSLWKQYEDEGRDFRWVSMPASPPRVPHETQGMDWNDHACLAGGDTFVLGKTVLVGMSGQDSTPAGAKWLERYLHDYGYRVETMRINEEFLHLDDGLACIDEGIAIVCEEQYAKYGMPAFLKGWDLINVTASEAKDLLAGNGLILGPKELIIDSRLPRIAEKLDKRGVTVHMLDYDAVTTWCGGFRCSHHPVVREL